MIQSQLKLRLNSNQETILVGWLWNLTGVYNWAIRKIELATMDGRYYSPKTFQNLLAGHSERMGIPSHVLQGTLVCAYDSWTRYVKNITKRPHLKSRRNKLNSIPFPDPIRPPKGNRITLLGVGPVRFYKQAIPVGKIKCGRVVRRSSGWYLCLWVDAERAPIERVASGEVGIDPGFNNLLTISTGEKVEHPRELEDGARRLAQAQRGRNAKLVARHQERLANRRKDRNHKLSLELVRKNILIVFSADNHKGIASRFGKSVSSSSHSQLRRMLSYKSRAGGTKYVEVDPKYSTMTCSTCGARTGPTGLGGLAVRQWRCEVCGTSHDRDVNAAVNTLLAGAGAAHEVRCAVA